MATTVVRRSHFPSLLVFVALVALGASAGALFEPGAWYQQLIKASWNPPDWIFAPVWIVLYVHRRALGGWYRRRH